MKIRPDGFLSEENISHDSEIFDYIRELHEYLWAFVRAVNLDASGHLDWFVDDALADLKDERSDTGYDFLTTGYYKEDVE